MPQVYAIASHRGLEIGFAASISEDDYFDAAVKARNRGIIPFIYAKLPKPNDETSLQLESLLAAQGRWHFNEKTRLVSGNPGFDRFTSADALFGFLRGSGEEKGGGAICRTYALEDLQEINLEEEFVTALGNFAPLLAMCAPTSWDLQIRAGQMDLEALSDKVVFDPASAEDGRVRTLVEIARRQGQTLFRSALINAYDGSCTITGTSVLDVLEAAHITPYRGPETNDVSNGLLLRADLHNLFDLGLVTVDPNTFQVLVSPRLEGTEYWALNGKPIRQPVKPRHRPSPLALDEHFRNASGTLQLAFSVTVEASASSDRITVNQGAAD